MKKKLVGWIVTLFAVCCIFNLSANAMTRAEFDAKLANWQSTYYDGYHWYGSFDGGIQCYGYAHMTAYNIFGSYAKNWTKSYSLDGVKAGDVVQYGNTTGQGHTIFVTNVSGDTITFTDCNSDSNCGVKWNRTVSKSSGIYWKYSFSYRLVAPTLGQPLSAPTVTTSQSVYSYGSTVTISWNSISGATGYSMYLWGEKQGETSYCGNVSGTSWSKVLPPDNYIVYISAFNENDWKTSSCVKFTVNEAVTTPSTSTTYTDKGSYRRFKTQISNLNQSAAYIVASYDKNGNLLETDAYDDLTAGTAGCEIDLPKHSGEKYVKVFLWNSLKGMKPLCESEKITL